MDNLMIVNDEEVIIQSRESDIAIQCIIAPGNSMSDITHPHIWYTFIVGLYLVYILLNTLICIITVN